MKVLHVCESITGGIASYLDTILPEQILKYGLDNVHIVIPFEQKSSLDVEIENVFYFYNLSRKRPLAILKILGCYMEAIKKTAPEVIHAHSTFAGFYLRFLALLGLVDKKKIVYCSHGWAFDRVGSKLSNQIIAQIERFFQFYAKSIICISRHDYEVALENGIRDKKLVIVSNTIKAIDKSNFPYRPIEIDKQKINLLFVGRYDSQKGFDILLQAIDKGISNQIHFYFIGKSIVDSSSLDPIFISDNVTYLGWQDKITVYSYMKECDGIFIPSRWEGFGLVALEALCNGCPVYYSNVGGLKETCINYEFCTPIKELSAEGINELLNSLSKSELNVNKEKCLDFRLIYNERSLCEALDVVYRMN